MFDKNFSLGVDVYRRDLNNWNYYNRDNTTFEQATTGFRARASAFR